MGSPYPLANAAEARWKKTLGLRDNPFHDLTCRWDIMDQRASFTSYHSGDIEVATLARCNIIARHLVRSSAAASSSSSCPSHCSV